MKTRIVDFNYGLVDANQKPVDAMLKRVVAWLMAGDRVFAFLATETQAEEDAARAWLDARGMQDIELTDLTGTIKLDSSTEFWSTRVVQITKEGRPVGQKAGYARDA